MKFRELNATEVISWDEWELVREPEISKASYNSSDYGVLQYKDTEFFLKVYVTNDSYGCLRVDKVEPIKGTATKQVIYTFEEE